MLSLRKPQPQTIQGFLERQRPLDLTYDAVGATAGQPPVDFVIDHTRVMLGTGEQTFAAGRAALESWEQFRLGWLEPSSPNAPIRVGAVVAVLARSAGLWWLNACRIVYVIDEHQPLLRFGFAYGTLPDHAGSGEERFLIEMDDAGIVWYDILAFSQPRHVLARLGYPYVRRVQNRFGRESTGHFKIVVQKIVEQYSSRSI